MPKSSAQRQATYRLKNFPRINTAVSSQAFYALDRLARYHGVTKKAMLEQLLIDTEKSALDSLVLDSPEWERYFRLPEGKTSSYSGPHDLACTL